MRRVLAAVAVVVAVVLLLLAQGAADRSGIYCTVGGAPGQGGPAGCQPVRP